MRKKENFVAKSLRSPSMHCSTQDALAALVSVSLQHPARIQTPSAPEFYSSRDMRVPSKLAHDVNNPPVSPPRLDGPVRIRASNVVWLCNFRPGVHPVDVELDPAHGRCWVASDAQTFRVVRPADARTVSESHLGVLTL